MYEKRIAEVFGKDDVPEISEDNLLKYRDYLLARLDKNEILTGREDFPWEEGYVFGILDAAEYQELKKTRLSYTDEFRLVDISEKDVAENDLIAKVERLSDRKEFMIGLSWITTKDGKSKDYQLLDDFAMWVVNW